MEINFPNWKHFYPRKFEENLHELMKEHSFISKYLSQVFSKAIILIAQRVRSTRCSNLKMNGHPRAFYFQKNLKKWDFLWVLRPSVRPSPWNFFGIFGRAFHRSFGFLFFILFIKNNGAFKISIFKKISYFKLYK